MTLDFHGNILIRHQSVPDCEWCDKAKELLDQKEIKYTVIYSDKVFFNTLIQQTESKKVPQIILDGTFVGGYNELQNILE
jgi:glutaredoxin